METERLYREALDMKLRLDPEDVDVAKAMTNLANPLMIQGKYDEAEGYYKKALAMRIDAYGREDSGDVAKSLKSLATLYYTWGDMAKAEPLLLESLEIRQRRDELDKSVTTGIYSALGRVYHAQGRHEEAREQLQRALDRRLELLGEDHDHVAISRRDLAALLVDLGELEEAERLLEEALGVLVRVKGAGSWEVAVARSVRGALRSAQGKDDEALKDLVEGYETLRRIRGDEAIYTRDARHRLRARTRTAPGAQPAAVAPKD